MTKTVNRTTTVHHLFRLPSIISMLHHLHASLNLHNIPTKVKAEKFDLRTHSPLQVLSHLTPPSSHDLQLLHRCRHASYAQIQRDVQ